MSNNLRTRNGMPFNFVNGLKVRGMDIESLIPGIEGIPEAGSKYQFAGDGTNKSFTLPVSPYNKDAVDMYVKQLYVHPDDYTLVGDTVTLAEAPPAVVVGETYNVVVKVSLTTLNGYVNANRVSFEGENLDDILEKGKPLANYSNLRAYAGAATQVRITDPGIAGFFYYDASDTTSVDNGGTIIVASNGKRWKRLFDGAVNVMWFMSSDQIADVKANLATIDTTSSIQLAINYLISIKTSGNNGVGTLYFPKGKYLVNGTLSLTNVYGLAIRGDGMYATAIVKKTDSGNLFSLQTYGRVDVRDIFFSHETSTSYTTWTNVLFNLDGSAGGNHFSLENVETLGFGTVVKYNANSLNEDTNFFRKIRCSNFKTFLYSRSSQAIINSIRDSTLFGTCANVFDISGFGHLHVDTCNVVVSGRVFDLSSGQVGPQSNYMVTNTKFEYWPQGGNVGTTQLIVMNADMSARFFFYGGGLAGGAPDPTVKQLVIRGTLSQIVFEGGAWDNRICIENYDSVGATVFGSYVHPNCFVKFKECVNSPSPANVTYNNAGVGVSYMGVVWEACQDRPNLCLTGLSNGQTYNSSVPSESLVNRATFTGANSGGNIMNGATATTFPYPHYGQPAILSRVRVIIHSSGAFVSGTIKMFSDSAKTTQIGSTQAIPNGSVTVPIVYDLTIPNNSLITQGVWVEITNTNGIYAYGRVFIETISI